MTDETSTRPDRKNPLPYILTAIVALIVLALFIQKQNRPVTEAEAGLKDYLFDPYTAKFENVTIRTDKTSEYICGRVNAKNRMGAYTGMQRFIIWKARLNGGPPEIVARRIENAENADFEASWQKECLGI